MKTKIILLSMAWCLFLVYKGTAQTPFMVKDINPTGFSLCEKLTNVKGTLFLRAFNGVDGLELWKSDGTSAGTAMVKDINPGTNSSSPDYLTVVGNWVYFQADNGTNGPELWKSDGSETGTIMVKDINAGSASCSLHDLTEMNGKLYFFADNGLTGFGLWKSDGTSAGTVLLKEAIPGYALTVINSTLFFSGYDNVHGTELWKSDGTAAGTVMVADIAPGITDGLGSYPFLTNVNGTLFFRGKTANAEGSKLFKSDGTPGGTVMVKDINPNTYSSTLWGLTNVNGTLFFTADDGTNGNELWKSNGTEAGTVMVKDIKPGVSGSDPLALANADGTLYFQANDAVHAIELWKSDGTSTGTVMVKDVSIGLNSSEPNEFTFINGNTYFVANDGMNGRDLFKTDGTTNGTVDFNVKPGATSLTVTNLKNVNGTLFFTVGDNGDQLWALHTSTVPTSVNQNSEADNIRLYPNPTNGNFVVETNGNHITKIKIFDVNGKTVYGNSSVNQQNQAIDITGMARGIYVLKIYAEAKSLTQKILVE